MVKYVEFIKYMEGNMLQLKNITKNYISGDTTVQALKGISITFRENEFVSILGQSGCGKTTMLNIIGGLDRYTEGDLIIGGRSTKEFKDRDWDSYRNHKIGFIFQSYNLIPHQTVLSNVELALTLSGVSKSERRKRAVEALEKVGLGDQINKKPNQMSGGQMQRVAIARALVNDPDIILADEPTGALDSETSVQIMNILKEISSEKLIIMVTHNAELAVEYSNRIVKLLDGRITDDSNPYEYKESEKKAVEVNNKKEKVSMSFFTALSLSFKNLLTKKGRTFLTAFAGSIGIIGIALILSLSSGFQGYIDRVQEDTVSTYPITIENENVDFSSMMQSMMGKTETVEDKEEGRLYAAPIISQMLNTMVSEVKKNNLTELKKFFENGDSQIKDYILDIQYQYDVPLNIYSADYSDGINKVNPSTLYQDIWGMSDETMSSTLATSFTNTDMWSQMIDNQELLESQYDLVAGSWPSNYNEVVIVADKHRQITDLSLYALGIRNSSELKNILINMDKNSLLDSEATSYSYEELMNLKFKLVLPTSYYKFDEATGTYKDMSSNTEYVKNLIDNGIEIKVSGIIVANEDAVATSINGSVGYTKHLADYVVAENMKADILKKQLENKDIDVFTNLPFSNGEITITMDEINAYIATLPTEQQQMIQIYISGLTEDLIIEMFKSKISSSSSSTYESNIEKLGYADINSPSKINIYAKDFESKDAISDIIKKYNEDVKAAGKDDLEISYTDYIGLMMSSVSTVIDAISYVLIAFVSISLVVSSIMIGIITYISVLERTKEIGILRSIGASKHDISRVFNAETMIIGLVSGSLGILVTVLLNIPINIIIKKLSGIGGVSSLPVAGALILIGISVVLTLIAGLVPARVASKKDPVVALRTE